MTTRSCVTAVQQGRVVHGWMLVKFCAQMLGLIREVPNRVTYQYQQKHINNGDSVVGGTKKFSSEII